jgi:hypothetical protein
MITDLVVSTAADPGVVFIGITAVTGLRTVFSTGEADGGKITIGVEVTTGAGGAGGGVFE